MYRLFIVTSHTNGYIYFDLNAPVITNTSVVKIDYSSSVTPIVVQSGNYLLIYPNPVQAKLTVRTSSEAPIVIYNMMGEQVFDGVSTEGTAMCDISTLAPGIYMIRCGELCRKFIKSE